MNTIALLVIVPLILPVLIILGGALIGGLIGGVIGYAVEEIMNYFSKKGFAILGTRATGKTTLHHFLRSGVIEVNTKQTSKEKVKSGKIILEDMELFVKEATDIGGADNFEQEWETIIKDSDYIIYIINSAKLLSNTDESYIKKIKQHLNLIHISNNKQKPVILFASHMDEIDGFPEDADRITKDIDEIFMDNKIIIPKNSMTLFGNLKDEKGAAEFTKQMLTYFKENNL